LVDSIMLAGEIVQRMVAEAEQIITDRLPSMLRS